MKKITILGIISIFILSILVTGCKKEQSQLDIDFTLGYDNALKISGGNPLTATIKNNGKAIDGELSIVIAQSASESLIYSKEFQISENGEKEIHMVLPLYTIQKKFQVSVVSQGKTIYTNTINAGRYISPRQPIIGVVTDQPDEYRFLNLSLYENYYGEQEMASYYYNNKSTVEEGNEQEIKPEVFYFDNFDSWADIDNLSFFNYIYLGDHSNLKLSDKIEQKLLDWVSKGGTLIVETGEDYKRLYSFLPESITNFVVEEVSPLDADVLFESYPLDTPITLAKGQAIHDSNTLNYEEDKNILAQYTQINQGQIINLFVDLTQSTLDNWPYKSQIIDEFLRLGVNGTNTLFDTFKGAGVGSSTYFDMLGYIPTDKEAPYGVMTIVFLIYITAVSIGLYFILKRKDRRDYMWIGVPILSLICLVFLYVLGFNTRFTKPIVNMVSDIEYNDGSNQITITSTMAVFNNQQGNMNISWDSSEKIETTSNPYNYYYEQQSNKKKIIGKVSIGSRTTYEVYNTPLWSKSFLEAKKVIPFEPISDEKFVSLEIQEETLYLSIYNKTPFDLDSAYIEWGNSFIFIGKLLGNEKKNLDIPISEVLGSVYDLNNYVLNNLWNYADTEEEVTELKDNINMLLQFSDNSAGYYGNSPEPSQWMFNEISIKGINKSSIGYDLLVNNDEADSFNRNAMTINTSIEFTKGTQLSLPKNLLVPSVMAGFSESDMYPYYIDNYGFDDAVGQIVTIYNQNILEFKYLIPEYLDITQMSLLVEGIVSEQDLWNKNEFVNIPTIPDVSYFIYNVNEDEFVDYGIDNLGNPIDIDPGVYVDENHELRIRVKFDSIASNLKEFGKSMYLPEITIEGSAK